MGREIEHDRPQVEYADQAVNPLEQQTIGEHGIQGRIYEVIGGDFAEPILAQLCDDRNSATLLVDPRDGISWAINDPDAMVIVKRYNARLVLTEVK